MDASVSRKAGQVERALKAIGYKSAYREEVDYANTIRLTTSNVGSDDPLSGVIVTVYGGREKP